MTASNVHAKLGSLLPAAIAEKIASSKVAGPICCVRICYFDTHAPSTYLALRITTQARRDKILAERGRDALYTLWAPGEDNHDVEVYVPDERVPASSDESIRRLFAQVYESLADDSEEEMADFQRLIQNVAQELNAQDWSKRCQVTDDFVVAPGDGSRYFGGDADYDDLMRAIPLARLDLLRSRGLLGPGENWDQRPGFEYAGAELSEAGKAFVAFEAKVRAMPAAERIAYLIVQLKKMAREEESDMTRMGLAEGWPIDRLQEVGSEG